METNRTLKLIRTEDGSSTIYLEELNETFHSLHGAVQESAHVFIKSGLAEVAASHSAARILEIGFGTGLNVLLTLEYALQSGLNIEMHTLEPFPLPLHLVEQLNYQQFLSPESAAFWMQIHQAEWNRPLTVVPGFSLHKIPVRLEDYPVQPQYFDLIYYDAFAPSKQAEMWSPENLEKTALMMKSGAVLVTYCANGQFKRNLKGLGLEVETLAGPPGKKEMVRAKKI